ncbi:hypothetical protein [Arthrobacter sp. CAL618]|uniref:hypothetical protein n=1 Tax=Arthrobacter sp. CAL618 TaxID=1055770 RepID=UPI0003F9EE60|nr:hypothetical protein [Arthrobacter sp. CAL618]
MKPGTGVQRTWAGGVLTVLLVAPTLFTAAAAAPPGGTQLSDLRYYQAAVNLFPETDGAYAGAVSFRQEVKGEASVEVFLSRAATISCPDLSEDIATTTVQTEGRESREPGPVELDIGRSLDQAVGHAIVDLRVTDSPGCGEPESVSVLSAQEVQITVTGTTPRFFTGIGGTTSSGSDRSSGRSYDFARDGTGTLSVGSLIAGVESPAAFLKFAVERQRTRGEAPVAPDPVAPPGGTGARGDYSAEFEPAGGLGVLFEDAIVQASTTSPPERVTTVSASSLTVELVDCGDGATALREQFVVGSGPGVLSIGRKLGTATASGAIQFERFVTDGCQGGETVTDTVVLPVTLTLTATAPIVRVSDTRWQIRPGEGAQRTKGWYLGREAAGTVAVGAVAGTVNLAAIGSSGP